MKRLTAFVAMLLVLTLLVSCGPNEIPDVNDGGGELNGNNNSGNTNDNTDNEEENKLPTDIVGGWGEPGDTNDPTDPDPHTHEFVNGRCECGETDPNYDPTPTPDPEDVDVYLLNRAEWEFVAVYYWNDVKETDGSWPGEKLSLGQDGLYKASFDSDFEYLVFNNNGRGLKTEDLPLPVDNKIVYDNLDNVWLTYDEAMDIVGEGNKPDPDPHTHVFVEGRCECGEIDPTYNPNPDPNATVIYLLNSSRWDEVAVYYWNMNKGTEIPGGWPGARIYLGSDGLYKATITDELTHLIFNNNNKGAQTADLAVPTDNRIVYDNGEKVWMTYAEAMAILNGGVTPDPDPHTHVFVEGKCECGEIDPNYNPTPDPDPTPHTHSFVNGKCECGETDPNYNPNPDPIPTPNPGDEDPDMVIFNALFDETSHVSIKLNISNSELKKIQQDYEKYSSMGSKSPIYRMADLVITITTADGKVGQWTIPQVGVRMKGNTSRTSFYSDNDGMYNLVHFKISFQETFDDATYYGKDALTWDDADARKARKNRTFATLEKIDMRWNRNDDTTYIRENYAYELYREFGVLAPHTSLASVDIGKDHAGVWVIYEPIDKIFLEKNLPAEALGGDLYKLGWTSEGATFTSFSSYGVEDEDKSQFYVYDLKTNKKTSTHQSLKTFINTIKSSSASKATIESILDVENFMYYCAVSYMVGNCDDLRNNYNNSYIYFRPDTGKMIVIPYDMDRGLGVNTWNPYGHGMTKDDPFTKKNVCGDQRSPLFLKTVCQGGFFINEYIEALKEVDGSEMLTNEVFKASFDIASSLYSAQTKTSKTYNNAGWCKFRFDINRTCSANESKNMSFADYISAKRATLYSKIGDQGNTDDSGSGSGGTTDSATNSIPYIMGDMNGWQVNSNYAMKSNGDGTFSFTVTPSHVSATYGKIKLKIFDDYYGAWYGGEIIDVNCNVPYDDNNGNRNIYLDPGTYVLTFDAKTKTLYIEKK